MLPPPALTSARSMTGTRTGCPVPRSDLRYLRMTYLGFDGFAHQGEMVVNRTATTKIVSVFRRAYNARFPIYRMRLVDEYRGSDDASMAANNTSAFNCRRSSGGTAWSQHSYGRAIDVNPVQNPYLTTSSIAPPAGRRFAAVDRSAGTHAPPGVIVAEGPVVDAFARIGWEWGGTWSSGKDYQHFSYQRPPPAASR